MCLYFAFITRKERSYILTLTELKDNLEKEVLPNDPMFSTSCSRKIFNSLLIGEDISYFVAHFSAPDIQQFDQEIYKLVNDEGGVPYLNTEAESKRIYESIEVALLSLPSSNIEEAIVF